jgi:hypothetical protein
MTSSAKLLKGNDPKNTFYESTIPFGVLLFLISGILVCGQ